MLMASSIEIGCFACSALHGLRMPAGGVDRFTVQCEVPMPKADEREKILRLILQKHCRESLHSEDAVDRILLEVLILPRRSWPGCECARGKEP